MQGKQMGRRPRPSPWGRRTPPLANPKSRVTLRRVAASQRRRTVSASRDLLLLIIGFVVVLLWSLWLGA